MQNHQTRMMAIRTELLQRTTTGRLKSLGNINLGVVPADVKIVYISQYDIQHATVTGPASFRFESRFDIPSGTAIGFNERGEIVCKWPRTDTPKRSQEAHTGEGVEK